MDGDKETVHHTTVKYITDPSDASDADKVITLSPLLPPRPLIIDESARFNFVSGGIINIINPKDHLYHYITGAVNQSVFRRTGACHINYLLLGLDAIQRVEYQDALPSLERKTSPLLYDRAAKGLTVIPNENTELCVFLSFSYKYQSDHRNIIQLSRNKAWNVQAGHQSYKIYFHPSNMAKDHVGKQYMFHTFPSQQTNFDSEINAVYALLQNQHLITQFLETLPPQNKIMSLGLRYYSFLDMCERCQHFLEANQPILRPLFMATLQQYPQLQKVNGDTPFTAVAHSNRIYTQNDYLGKKQISIKGYPYATSGSKTGTFVGELPKYNGKILPLPASTNRLMALIHEPDLGDQHEYGIVRQYFSQLTKVDFSQLGLKDKQALTLGGKLGRTHPETVKIINLSGNSFGMEDPELGDDPIPLTSGDDLVGVFDFISRCTNIQDLRVAGNYLTGGSPFDALLKALPTLQQLRILDLSDIGGGESAGSRHIEHLAGHLHSLALLETLDLNHNFIYPEGAQAITAILPNLVNLRELCLAYAALCHRDGRTYADDPYIESLIYDPDSFFALAQAIGEHPSIQYIDVRHYEEQIEKEDIERFIQIVTGKKPNITIVSESKPFVNKYSYEDNEFFDLEDDEETFLDWEDDA